jgi:hypothetical protein
MVQRSAVDRQHYVSRLTPRQWLGGRRAVERLSGAPEMLRCNSREGGKIPLRPRAR